MAMNFGNTILSIFLAIIQTMILIGFGVILAVYKVIDDTKLVAISRIHYCCLIPTFSLLGIMGALDVEHPSLFFIITLGNIIMYAAAFGIGFIIFRLFKIDERVKGMFLLLASIGNLVILPGIIIESSCKAGGVLTNMGYQSACTNTNNGWIHANSALVWYNISLWLLAIPLVNMDKRVCIDVKCMLKDILQYYPSAKEFVSQNQRSIDNEETFSARSDTGFIQNLTTRVEEEFTKVSMYKGFYENFKKKHQDFIRAMQAQSPGFKREIPIYKEVGFKFVLAQFIEPPILLSLFGVICAMVVPMKKFMLNDKGGFAMFLGTFTKVGNMTVPMSLFILGSKLFLSIKHIKALLVKKKDIVALCLSKMVMLPIIGFGIIWALSRLSKSFEQDLIAQLLLNIESAMPASITLMTAFVIGGHGSNEAAIMMLWEYIICIIPVTIVIFIWSLLNKN